MKNSNPQDGPRVSVLIPTKNRARLLVRGLDALRGQSDGDYEVIVSDNASTDDTAEVCRQYADCFPSFRYIYQEVEIPAISNWRACLDAARGQYSFILCDDDVLIDPAFISSGVDALSESGCSLLIPECMLSNGERTVPVRIPLPQVVAGKEFFLRYWIKPYGAPIISCLFRTELARECDAFADPGILYADIELWLKLMLLSDVYVYRRPAFIYSFHGGNIVTGMTIASHSENIRFLDRVGTWGLHRELDSHVINKWKSRMVQHYLRRIVIPDCIGGRGNLFSFARMCLRNQTWGNATVSMLYYVGKKIRTFSLGAKTVFELDSPKIDDREA